MVVFGRVSNPPLPGEPCCISEIINGKRSITDDKALRLGKYFDVAPEIWLNLQTDYD